MSDPTVRANQAAEITLLQGIKDAVSSQTALLQTIADKSTASAQTLVNIQQRLVSIDLTLGGDVLTQINRGATASVNAAANTLELRRTWAYIDNAPHRTAGVLPNQDTYYFYPTNVLHRIMFALEGNAPPENLDSIQGLLATLSTILNDGLIADPGGVSPDSAKVTLQLIKNALDAVDAGVSASNERLQELVDCSCHDTTPPDVPELPSGWGSYDAVHLTQEGFRRVIVENQSDNGSEIERWYTSVMTGATNTNYTYDVMRWEPNGAGQTPIYKASLESNGDSDFVFLDCFNSGFAECRIINTSAGGQTPSASVSVMQTALAAGTNAIIEPGAYMDLSWSVAPGAGTPGHQFFITGGTVANDGATRTVTVLFRTS